MQPLLLYQLKILVKAIARQLTPNYEQCTHPFLGDVHHSQVDQLHQCHVIGKDTLGFGHLSYLTVEALDGVSCVNQSSDMLIISKIGRWVLPSFVAIIPRQQGIFLPHLSCSLSRLSSAKSLLGA